MTAQQFLRPQPTAEVILQRGMEVIRAEAGALDLLARSLDSSFVEACDAILNVSGRVVVTGMGKSGHIGRKWAATMAATGTPAIYVHPAEAAHGDVGMLVPGDILIVISNSGNTSELRAFLRYAASIRVKVIGVASRRDSIVMENADSQVVPSGCSRGLPREYRADDLHDHAARVGRRPGDGADGHARVLP